MALRRAYLSMHRQADAALSPYGLTATQFVVLMVLSEGDAVTQRELVERVASDPNTIRPVLIAMEAQGLVTRDPHPADNRARAVQITPAGRALQREAFLGTQPFRDRLTATLSDSEVRSLVGLLDQVTLAMTEADNAV